MRQIHLKIYIKCPAEWGPPQTVSLNTSCNMPSYTQAKSLQSCLTLCDPVDSSPPGSSVHGILQARILEWVAISFSKYGLDYIVNGR